MHELETGNPRRSRRSGITEEDRERGRRFAQWVQASAALKGWNKTVLAAESGLRPTTIGIYWEGGYDKQNDKIREPEPETIAAIAKATGADEDAGRLAGGLGVRISSPLRNRPFAELRPGEVWPVIDYDGEGEIELTEGLVALLRERKRPRKPQ